MDKIDPRIGIWNTLHDGEFTVLGREGSDTLVVFISIPYLRERMRPLGDSIVLRLFGVRQFELADLDGKTTSTELEDLSRSGVEILSTDSLVMPVKIATTQGYVVLDFDRVAISLDTGQEITYESLFKVCSDYWEEFAARGNILKAK